MHGRFPIQRLRALSPEWVRDISQGEIGPAASKRWAFLDTETTGLAGGTGTCAFLVGVGSVESQGFRVRLFFMRDFDEEAAMLKALAEHLSRYQVLLTYNGKTFDAPLLETRFRMQRQRNPLAEMGHIDLLHPARRLWRERMSNCRLATLESEILGFRRRGDIPGFLIPQRYFEFLRTRRGAGLRPVFFHNVRDIVSLACLGSVVMSSYSDPGRAPLRHGQDLMGLAQWLTSTRRDEVALRLYRSAIRAGLPNSCLARCLLEAARIERRLGNPRAQVELLRDLLRIPEVDHSLRVEALEALAKHFEHVERNYAKALHHTRTAQRHAPGEDLWHRENRLLQKIASK
ncbi:MAG: ribonuclease H-like domain-containing protein [Bryobacterales bacterium]|nr:ribonuclease H-like domain-containing protein [Bryobacterales bacterium]